MSLLRTPLDALHRRNGARMVPFAGYDMPVQYAAGIIAEHEHCRAAAALFDVSHMGQLVLHGPDVTATLESLVPADLASLAVNRQCYTLLTNDEGGVRDDLIVTRWAEDTYFLVVNAACKAEDRAYIESALGEGQELRELEQQGLLALQGPAAREVLGSVIPGTELLHFLDGGQFEVDGETVYVTCSGYTGEDGFEISVDALGAAALARRLLEHEAVAFAGLGARDSLRLEAGLCLYGHELSPEITPVEAGLNWVIARARREDGARPGAYPGAAVIAAQMKDGVDRRRVGLRVQGRRPVREGQPVLDGNAQQVGEVTSGGFGPTVGAPIAMALVAADSAQPGTELVVDVRGKDIPVRVEKMPLVPQRYFRG